MKVAIIGAGNVGSTLAFTLLIKGEADAISLIDVNAEKALGEVLDLSHGLSFTENIDIRAEGYEGIENADIVVITAGRNRRPDESRLDLARANVKICEEIVDAVKSHYHGAIVIVVSNPIDILTYVTYKRLGIDRRKVIGSGTVLDTSRFRTLLGREFDIDPRNIHAYIIGEHGDSSVAVWSMASLGQIPIADYAIARRGAFSDTDRKRIYEAVLEAGKEVIRRKGATFYAIALSVARIIDSLIDNEKGIYTVSSYIENFPGIDDVCLSLPAVLDRDGIREILPISLNDDERIRLAQSAEVLKRMIREIGY